MLNSKENSFIYADPTKCLGCRSCEIACAVAHGGGDLVAAVLEKKTLQPRNSVVLAGQSVMPIQCRQCEDAPCAHACPTKTIYQEDGLVKINGQNCIGCKICAMVCPFGAIIMASEGVPQGKGKTNRGRAYKCDLCADRIEDGTDASCACVEACPTKAIALVNFEEYRARIMESRAREIAKAHTSEK